MQSRFMRASAQKRTSKQKRGRKTLNYAIARVGLIKHRWKSPFSKPTTHILTQGLGGAERFHFDHQRNLTPVRSRNNRDHILWQKVIIRCYYFKKIRQKITLASLVNWKILLNRYHHFFFLISGKLSDRRWPTTLITFLLGFLGQVN